jgi:peroxiredoxin
VVGLLLVAVAAAAGVFLLSPRDRNRGWTPIEVPDSAVTEPRRVRDFALRDVAGNLHTPAEWREARAVVLFFLGTECPVSNAYAPEMEATAQSYAPRGVAFFGVHPDPDVTAEAAARHAAEYRLGFPVLLDPGQVVAGQAGVSVTPEAVVMTPEGYVVYSGRIDDRYSAEGRRADAARVHDLADALDAALADEMPAVARAEPFGCPLPPLRAAGSVSVFGSEDDRPVTFTKDVAPILWNHCAGCHRPGEVAPFSLLTYKDAAKRAEFLKRVTASRRMPPWRAAPGYGHFLDDLRLNDRQVETLARWADAGAPEGDPADLPPPPEFPTPESWALGAPDLVVTTPEPFAVPAGGEDVYRAFVVPVPLDRAKTVVAAEFRPGNRKVVHHARVFIDDEGDEFVRRDEADPGPGFRSGGGVTIPRPGLTEWVPGVTPRRWPEGCGKVLGPRSRLIILVHYHPSGKPETDRSSLALYLRDEPPTRLMTSVPLWTTRIDIPPGASRHEVEVFATLPADVHAFAVMPHGHYLMRDIQLNARLPDGTVRPLLRVDDWDFNWQGSYRYVKPIKLPRGTTLHAVAHYDNSTANPSNPSSPPRRVRFGEGSTDEMFGCFLHVIADTPADYEAMRKKWPRAL